MLVCADWGRVETLTDLLAVRVQVEADGNWRYLWKDTFSEIDASGHEDESNQQPTPTQEAHPLISCKRASQNKKGRGKIRATLYRVGVMGCGQGKERRHLAREGAALPQPRVAWHRRAPARVTRVARTAEEVEVLREIGI